LSDPRWAPQQAPHPPMPCPVSRTRASTARQRKLPESWGSGRRSTQATSTPFVSRSSNCATSCSFPRTPMPSWSTRWEMCSGGSATGTTGSNWRRLRARF
jgi:hypothetical protein